MRVAICIVVIQNGRILLCKKKETWILPGGKPEVGESDIECIVRELREEFPELQVSILRHYGDFVGVTPHKGDELCARVYLAEVSGSIVPSAEISESAWTDKPEDYKLSDITQKIILSLRQTGCL